MAEVERCMCVLVTWALRVHGGNHSHGYNIPELRPYWHRSHIVNAHLLALQPSTGHVDTDAKQGERVTDRTS